MAHKPVLVSFIVHRLLTFVSRILAWLSDVVFPFIHSNKAKTPIPPISNPLLLESATSLAAKIRTRKITSEQVVHAFLERIEAVNPILNCMVEKRFEQALEEARNVDRFLQSTDKDSATIERETPFLGVPFTIKDSFLVQGLRNTAGLVKSKDTIGHADADVVFLMKKAGGILLGLTNVPELCMSWETNNKIYGRTSNPYDVRRIAGGSSGGEAALLASAGSPIGIGSDIAGSIRQPAHVCGIYGHKPTRDVVSIEGHQPKPENDQRHFLVAGPMSRFCSDLLPLYRVLAGENVSKLQLDAKVPLSKLRYFYVEHFGPIPFMSRVHPDIKEAQMRAVRHIEDAFNVRVQKVAIDKLYHSIEMWLIKMSTTGGPKLTEALTLRQGKISVLQEVLKLCLACSEYTTPTLFLCILEKFSFRPNHPKVHQIDAMCEELLVELQELLGKDGVMLVPSLPTGALYHNELLTRPFTGAFLPIFNLLGFPVTQVPLGLGSWGVPQGIQVVSNLHNDHLTLAVAAELDRVFGGWISPSPIAC